MELQHQFFSAVTVLSTPQLEWLVDPGRLPGHVYFLSLVDESTEPYGCILHCAGGGG